MCKKSLRLSISKMLNFPIKQAANEFTIYEPDFSFCFVLIPSTTMAQLLSETINPLPGYQYQVLLYAMCCTNMVRTDMNTLILQSTQHTLANYQMCLLSD